MSDLMLAQKIIRERIPNITAIYLFGSKNTDYENIESDIDLAFLCLNKTEYKIIRDTKFELESQLNSDIDLIDLFSADTVFRFQILHTGKRVFCGNLELAEQFESLCFSMYVRFEEERQEIINDIKARGSVYD